MLFFCPWSAGVQSKTAQKETAMQTAKQLSVSLANKPGRLAAVLTALNKEKVGFRALSLMDSGDRGTLRFVPDDYDTAKAVLEKTNIRCDTSEVLLTEVSTHRGAFRNMCEKLASEHMNIDYAYCSASSNNGQRGIEVAVIKVNDLAKAQRVLGETGHQSRRKNPVRRPKRNR
jgi:hypothetical protein